MVTIRFRSHKRECPERGDSKLQRTITLPGVQGRIDHMAFDARTDRLFVAALGNNTVQIVDVKQGKRLHSISGLHEPQGILYLPDVNRLYVANSADGTVQVFDGTTYGLIESVSLGSDENNVRLILSTVRSISGMEAGPWAFFVRMGARWVILNWMRILSPFSSKPWAIEFS